MISNEQFDFKEGKACVTNLFLRQFLKYYKKETAGGVCVLKF